MTAAWDKFRQNVRDARRHFGKADMVWYRGHQKVIYKLVPSLYRYRNGSNKEQDLFTDFVEGGGRRFVKHVFDESGPEVDQDWMTLFDMQHYGIPTRLLDWTETFGNAVAFALLDREETNTEPAAVYVLSPASLNNRANPKRKTTIEIGKDGKYKYKELYWEGSPTLPQKPVAIETPKGYRNERMAAQHGRFTVHGTDNNALEEQFPDVVKKIILPKEALEDSKEFLRDAGITPVTLFPDIAGLALQIRTKHLGKLPYHLRKEDSCCMQTV